MEKSWWAKIKTALSKIKTPRPWVAILFGVLTLVAFVVTIIFSVLNFEETYVMVPLCIAFCLLGYFIYTLVYFRPKIHAFIDNIASKNKLQKERKNKKILRCENCKAKPILTYKVDYDIILL